MMPKPLIALGLGVVLLSGAAVARMAQPNPRISAESAKALAARVVPNAAVAEVELEEEDGRLIYSIEMREEDNTITEVEIDATTGDILGTEVEMEDEEDDDGADSEHEGTRI
jgi:uncharacterized membrane protein YkoI